MNPMLDAINGTEIAIIGMNGRFPGAPNLDRFWNNLINGVESISYFTDEQLASGGVPKEVLNNPLYVKARPILEGVDLFDASFFGYSPLEASSMDPQHRLFLECAWELLEVAGYDTETYDGVISVFAGANLSSYLPHYIHKNREAYQAIGEFLAYISNVQDSLATRVGYKLNLKGGCFSVQTACSTSLAAVHLACQNLRNFESDMAIAGGVSIYVPQVSGYWIQEGVFSPDGKCRAFDAEGKGMLFGNGLGMVALKRLKDAQRDGDSIEALIKGSAANNDGDLKVSFLGPSVNGQAAVIAEALADGAVHPETISYIEAHGTGTPLGDASEIAALTRAFQTWTRKTGFCRIGSVKPNIGHLNAASGIVSLIKTVLALKHEKIPPILHFTKPNPELNLPATPFVASSQPSDWKRSEAPRRAGMNSFGFGGTNVHVVVQEAPPVPQAPVPKGPALAILSAKSSASLQKAADNLALHLKAHGGSSLADTAFTLQVGRRAFNHRLMLVVRDIPSLLERLDPANRPAPQFQARRDPSVIFLFPAPPEDATRLINTALEAYHIYGPFRMSILECAKAFLPHANCDLAAILYPAVENMDKARVELTRPAAARAAHFALGYAMAKLWMAWGIKPSQMIGQGDSEWIAACLSGVFSLDDAARLVCAVQPLENAFDQASALPELRLLPPSIPFISNATGEAISLTQWQDPFYWAKPMRPHLEWAKAIRLVSKGLRPIFLELSQTFHPSPGAGQDHSPEAPTVIRSLNPAVPCEWAADSILDALGRLWLEGATVDWKAFHAGEQRRRLALPTYAFDRQRFWVEPPVIPPKKKREPQKEPRHRTISDCLYAPSWKKSPVPLLGAVSKSAEPEEFVVFLDDLGVAQDFVERLRALGHSVFSVREGDRWSKGVNQDFVIRPAERGDYFDLCSAIASKRNGALRLVHFWSLSRDAGDVYEPHFCERAMTMGFHSILFAVQALGELIQDRDVLVSIVSNNMHSVDDTEKVCPVKALALGLVKVLGQEYPRFSACNIDIVPEQLNESVKDQLFEEICLRSPDPIVAFRGRCRWTHCMTPVSFKSTQGNSSKLKKNGSYLIVGGLGGVGLLLAGRIAQTVPCNLILMGRTNLPPRDQWPSLLEADALGIRTAQPAAPDWNAEKVFVDDILQRQENLFGKRCMRAHAGLEEAIDRLCALYVLSYFHDSVPIEPGNLLDETRFFESLGIKPKFRKLFNAMITMLEQDGFLERRSNGIMFSQSKRDLPDPGSLKGELERKYPIFAGMLKLMEHCVGHYRQALRGEIESIGVLYPNGDSAFLNSCLEKYDEYNNAQLYLATLRQFVKRQARQARGRKIRILEVGGGVGALTRLLAAELKDENIEYCFTDLGQNFVLAAEREAQQWKLDFLKFKVFDITKDPAAQDFKLGSFDIVLGFNVVHATPRIFETIANLKTLLRPSGFLCLVEAVRTQRWADMTFGMAEGWWSFEDLEVRPSSPLMSCDRWETELRRHAFQNVDVFPQSAASRSATDSALVIAQQRHDSPELTEDETNWDYNRVEVKIRKILQIEASGSKVVIETADVSNYEQVQRVADAASQRFGAIDGVVHAAAIAGGGLIRLKTMDALKEEFAAKLRGTLVLEKIFRDKPLDFFLLCSSLYSVTGGFGQVGYCAANSFLDAFAHEQTNRGKECVSINWDVWRNVGLAVKYENVYKAILQRKIESSISADEGLDVFDFALKLKRVPQVIVSSREIESLIEETSENRVSSSLNELDRVKFATASQPRAESLGSYVPPKNAAESYLADLWQELLGVNRVGAEDDFMELGGNSLISLQITSRLRKTYSVELSPSVVFQARTVAKLASELNALIQGAAQGVRPDDIQPKRRKTIDQLLVEVGK